MTEAQARFLGRLREVGGVAITANVLSFAPGGWRVQARVLQACRSEKWVNATVGGVLYAPSGIYTETLSPAGREALATHEAARGR